MIFFNSQETPADAAAGNGSVVNATRGLILNPKTAAYGDLDGPSRELVKKTIAFFEDNFRL